MAFISQMPGFNNGYCSDWQAYVEQFNEFCKINEVFGEQRKSLLLTSIGQDVYQTLCDICHPTIPIDKSFDQLIELLNKQFCVKTSVFRERFNFYNSKQHRNESILQWFSRIKDLSFHCAFGDAFEMILLDRFIAGLTHPIILEQLYEMDADITLQQVIDLAITKESCTIQKNAVENKWRPTKTVPARTSNKRTFSEMSN